MPLYEVEHGGKIYEADAPDMNSAASAVTAFKATPAISPVSDTFKSFGSGIRSGVESLAGLPGDMSSLAGKTVDYFAGKHIPTEKELYPNMLSIAPPTSETIRQTTDNMVGKSHVPETPYGKVSETVGEFLPGGMAGPGGMASKAVRFAIAPALASEAAGHYTNDNPLAKAGAALGAAMFNPKRLLTPLPISAERQAAVDTLNQHGVELTAGQKTGSSPLKYAESALASVIGASPRASEIEGRQGSQFTQAVLSKVGENATHATPEVMDRAFTRIGQKFDDLSSRNTLQVDQSLAHDISNAQKDYEFLANPLQKQVVQSAVDDVIKVIQTNNGTIPGAQYQAMRSRLDKAARATKTSDVQLSDAMFDLKNSLDNAMERSIAHTNPGDLGEWKDVRNQYKNLLVVEKAASGAGEKAAEGIITPSQLRNATVNQSRRGYVRGQGDFADLARSGEAIMKPLPNSGTGQRVAINALLEGGLSGAGFYTGNPLLGVLGAATPALASRTLYSKPVQTYLANQLMAAPSHSGVQSKLLAAQLMSKLPPPQSGQ